MPTVKKEMTMHSRYRHEPTLDLNATLARLRKAKYKCDIETHGTIIAHRGDVHLGFTRRRSASGQQCYSAQVVQNAGA